MTQAIKSLIKWVLGLNKCKFSPTRIGKQYNLHRRQSLRDGKIPTNNQSGIEKESVLVSEYCILTVTDETCKLIEFKVSTNNTPTDSHNFARNGQLVWYEKDLFDRLDKKEIT